MSDLCQNYRRVLYYFFDDYKEGKINDFSFDAFINYLKEDSNFQKSKLPISIKHGLMGRSGNGEPVDPSVTKGLIDFIRKCYDSDPWNPVNDIQNAGAPSKVTIKGKQCTAYVKVNGEFMTVKQAVKVLSKKPVASASGGKPSSSKKSSKKTPAKKK